MKSRKIDAGLLRTILFSALVLFVGLGAAFGLEFWFPTYDREVAALSEELLPPVPGAAAANDVELYPWNYYDSAAAQPASEKERTFLQQYAVYILTAAYNSLSGGGYWPEADIGEETAIPEGSQALELAGRFVRVEASDGSFYFLKDAPVTLQKLGVRCTIDCALHFAYGIVYFRVQVPEEKEDMTEAALSKAADAVRAIVSGRDAAGWDTFYRQMEGLMGLRYVFEEEDRIFFDRNDLAKADILTADDRILLVGQSAAQWVLLFNPLTLRLEGFSIQL